ncbi:MAG: VWA domain-containing protein [Deltaproteobacteria bacterium]
MRKTLALFVAAFSMLIAALIFGLPGGPDPSGPIEAPVQTPPIAPPSAQAQATAHLGQIVTLDAALHGDYLFAQQRERVSLLMDLNAIPVERGGRAPISVAVVIDRSGSMAGDKIRQVRRAAKTLVERLADSDQIALVTYASDYAVDLPLTPIGGQRARITRIIDDILDGGGTNLAGGMQAGLDALAKAQGAPVRRLILLSDGNANQGITDPTSIAEIAASARQKGITISTLGVGLDFNEDLMTLVAQSGAGGYYYARNATAVAAAFEKELTGLVALAARTVEVGLELKPGVTVAEVYGYRTEMRGGRLVIPVGDMASQEKRRIMVQLDVNPTEAGPVGIGDVVLSYRNAANQDVREHRAALSMVATASHDQVASGFRSHVAEAFEQAQAAQAREAAATQLIAGDRDAAIARVRASVKRLSERNAKLKSDKLQQQIDEINDVLVDFEDVDLASDAAKDLVKSEKLRARQVFVY